MPDHFSKKNARFSQKTDRGKFAAPAAKSEAEFQDKN